MALNKIIRIFELAIIGFTVFVLSFLAAFFYLKVGDLHKITLSSLKNSIPKLFVVESGSMEPVIKTGSIVITEPSDIYAQNDVISFKSGKKVITHRIMYRSFPDGVNAPATYQTSGDANEDFDPFVVKQEQVVGKVVYDIPYIGYVANFAKQPYGFILLVIVPATIVIYEELKSLLGQIYSALLEHTKKKKKKEGAIPVSKKNRKGMFLLSRTSVLIPVFGAVFVFTGLAASYFSDKETSAGNVMQAGEWVSFTPGPGNVVINEINWGGSNGDGDDEWIELKNATGFDINLTNWVVENLGTGSGPGANIIIPSGTIPANGFFIISNGNKANSRMNVDPDYVTTSVSLNNGGEQLTLKDSSNITIDTANTTGAWFAGTNSTPKKSMERKTPPGTGLVSTDWQTANTHTNMDGSGVTDEYASPKAANSL